MDYFCVCFYTLLFTVEVNAIEQILENFVPVFKNSYFPSFRVIIITIEDKVFHYTLNIDGENGSVNNSEIVL